MNAKELLMALLRAEVCGGDVSPSLKESLTEEALEPLYTLAKAHDLAHIVGNALGKIGALPKNEVATQFRRQGMLAMMRCAQLEFEYENICAALEEAQIPYIPLKGAILRNYYPESWMRTSCDIDVLVKPEDVETAASALTEKYGYRRGKESAHDLSLYSSGSVHLELHHTAVEDGRAGSAQKVLGRIWEDAAPRTPGAYQHCLSDAMFYFYHIAHMAKHMEEGGSGVRSFLDLWIINNRMEGDVNARKQLLEEGGLLAFEAVAQRLTNAWFCGGETDRLAGQLEQFVLTGGVYGSVENNVAIKQLQMGNKLQYAFARIVPSYEKMKDRYPVLARHKWLLPILYVVRWFDTAFTGRVKASVQELSLGAGMSKEGQDAVLSLMRDLELVE